MAPPHRSGTRLVGLLALVLLPLAGRAQNLEPRLYANTPVGVNFLVVSYAYANGEVGTDAALPLENAKVQVNGAILGYARALDLGGMSGKIDAELPYAWVSGSADVQGVPQSRNVGGVADARMRLSVNLYGAPALSLEDFERYKQDLIVGASLQVMAPIGRYDEGRVLNIGNHRWAFKPEIGISKSYDPLILELSVAGTFYTDNHDFVGINPVTQELFAGNERSQNPIGSVQAHAIYSFRAGIWGALDFTYYAGGKTRINGVSRHDELSNTRLGGTVTFPVNPYNSVKLYGGSGISARAGTRFDLIGIAWQVRWGGGL